ncbi:MAG: SIMPL domain-containing protein [Patescibacteria group bacterium]
MENNRHFLFHFVVTVSVIVIALFFIKTLDISYPLTVVNTSRSSELAVVGEGKMDITPDTAEVNAGITVDNRPNVGDVQKTINGVNDKIIDALRKMGIEKGDIKTSNYSVYPNYRYDNNVNTISGYNGNATIQIKVRDTQMVSRVIEEVTNAGANQIQGVNFSIDKPETYREQVREMAIKNAKSQAEKIAKDLGISLGKITNIVESNPTQSGVVPMYEYAAKGLGGGGGGPTVESGTQTITSVVTLYFEKR